MKRRAGQAGRILGEALHQLGRIAMLLLVLVLLGICLLGLRLAQGPLEIPYLASTLATKISGQGIVVRIGVAQLAWAGYREGGGVPLYLRLAGIGVRNAVGVTLVGIPRAKLVFLPAALLGGGAPVRVSATDARFSGSDVPVSLDAAIWLGAGFRFAAGDFGVTLGAGRLGAGAQSLAITSGGFALHLTPRNLALRAGRLNLAASGQSLPHVGFIGAASLAKGGWAGTLRLTADTVRAVDLAAYWPAPLAPDTRRWVTTRIIGGTAEAGDFTFSLAAPANLASLAMTGVQGAFTGRGITLIWLPGAVPITALDGIFTVENAGAARVTEQSGAVGGVALDPGSFTITGMNAPKQFGTLAVGMQGKVADVLNILGAPPLNLLASAPPEVARATGTVRGTVAARIPFIENIQLADTGLHVVAELSDAALPSPYTGLGFSGGTASLRADVTGMDLVAAGQFADEPAHFTANIRFAGTGMLQDLDFSGLAGPKIFHALGLDGATEYSGPVTGSAPFTLQVNANSARLAADLTQAGLALPGLGWKKPAGLPGKLSLTVALHQGEFQDIETISAAAPELNISAQMRNHTLWVKGLNIGQSQASGWISPPARPGAPWLASFSGPMLALRPQPASAPQAAAPSANMPPSGPALRLNLAFAQLSLSPGPAPVLDHFSLSVRCIGATPVQANASASGIALSLNPGRPAGEYLSLQAPDTGLLLRATGAYQNVAGGTLGLTALYGAGKPLTGRIILKNFRLLQAPLFTKVLQGLSLYGLAQATSGPGLAFARAVIPFSLTPSTLTLSGARAYSASLGFTASGTINRESERADLDATLIPAYAINALPGKIPVIGHLFTAETGGGLIAIRAHITGTLDNPKVSVNPLSALTPGVLRDVFGLGGSK